MLGNDVVDLRTAAAPRHPRFDERVFSPGERAWLGTRSDAEQSRWWLWAAKEATFKAVRGVDPGVPFRPRCFLVEIAGEEGRSVHAWACHGSRRVAIRIDVDAERVHAVASLGPALVTRVARRRPGAAEGVAARELLLRAACEQWGAAPRKIRKRDRAPRLVTAEGGEAPVSISHHGRFVACAIPARAAS